MKKRRVVRGKRPLIPKVEIQRTFGGLGDENGNPQQLAQNVDMGGLPTLFLCIQVILHPDTGAELLVNAANGLAMAFFAYVRGLIIGLKGSRPLIQSNPTQAIQSIFALLTSLSTSPKLSSNQQYMTRDILMTLVEQTLRLVHDTCTKALAGPNPFTQLRESLACGIATVCHAAEPKSFVRQGLLLKFLAEFKRVRCVVTEKEVGLLAKDDMLWYLHNLIGEVVEMVGEVEGFVRKRIEDLMWEILSAEVISTVKGNWITWSVGGLICGIEGISQQGKRHCLSKVY